MKYLAFLDILGFKDIVNKNTHDELYNIYMTLFGSTVLGLSQNATINEHSETKIDTRKMQVYSRIISDSIILWTNDIEISSFVEIVKTTNLLLRNSIVGGLPLRGAICMGNLTRLQSKIDSPKFNCDALFGDALVKAYTKEGSQEWSGCVVENDCLQRHMDMLVEIENTHPVMKKPFIDILVEQGLLIKYNVPYKNDVIKEDYVINWVAKQESTFTEKYIRTSFSKYNKSIDVSDVEKKIKNTLDFVTFVSRPK